MRRTLISSAAFLLATALSGASAVADRLALRDGTTIDGAVVVDGAAKVVVTTRTRGGVPLVERFPFGKALAVETQDAGLSWLASDEDLLEASRVLWSATERDRYMDWAARAVKAGVARLATRFLDAAEKRGASGYALKVLRGKVPALARGSASDAEASALEALEAALPKERAALRWSRLEPRWAGLSDAKRVEWGGAVLAIDPAVDPVKRWFASLVPNELADKVTWQEWLAWKRVLGEEGRLRFPPPPGTPAKGMDPVERQMARAASLWHPEVRAIERRGLLVVTRPPMRPAFARATATATSLCAYLEAFFATTDPRRKELDPVVVWVHGEREDFLRRISKDEERWIHARLNVMPSERERQRVAFFAPTVGIAKVLWPDTPNPDDAGDESIRRDFAEQVAWAWLFARCPRFDVPEMKTRLDAPACFIDVAFAEALSQGRPDASKGVWTLARPDEETVAAERLLLKQGDPVPWEDVLDASLVQLETMLDPRANPEVAARRLLSWFLRARLAAEFLLFAADERTRTAFADQVTRYMSGKKDGLLTKEAYGVDARELGTRIAAWMYRVR